MKAMNNIIAKAINDPKRIVLPEGNDPRVIQAAVRASRELVARIVLLGLFQEIRSKADDLSLELHGVEVINPKVSENHDRYVRALYELRKSKGMTLEEAAERAKDPLVYANLMVRLGDADGLVAGAVNTTADVVRNAIQIVGVQPSFRLVSSFFLMMFCKPFHALKGGKIFSDCGLVVDPNAEELSEIAMAAADSGANLLMEDPRVAMLSFSTSGSAKHASVDKVAAAARRVKELRPDLKIDGDVQLDAAIVADIANRKVACSKVKGEANVLVFPNLDAGNIGYKLAERIAGAEAIGPLLQGLNKPANDLSRSCSATDIYHVIAVTVVQAQSIGNSG